MLDGCVLNLYRLLEKYYSYIHLAKSVTPLSVVTAGKGGARRLLLVHRSACLVREGERGKRKGLDRRCIEPGE